MNREDIIRMAREECPYTSDEMRGAFYEGFLKGAAVEREACEKVCESKMPNPVQNWADAQIVNALRECAAAIRARGNNGKP